MTDGVCDVCWGSGNKNRPWGNLRAMEARYDADLSAEAIGLLERSAGCGLMTCHGAIEAVCQLLEDASKPTRRKPRPSWFDETCQVLARVLRAGVEARKEQEVAK